ncbi:MAG: 6,7-dimethyl-8-ribityllumazine synthase [Acidobacteria bacterium]|jgi:6,7-dimethyl-8-ribityllumazine synthase|nr:6,7-dimethyl-8-ribityllumazine synthase [Acidobacteriota bacterium]|tara:strand:- start:2724 stop:3137 length:414 start_codon:yes stop_codon:yes gene_type:complete
MKVKIAIVISDFNEKITSKMEKAAETQASSLNAEIVKKIHVPGAFEIPFAAKNILEKEQVDAVVALGAVIQGDTDHDIVVANSAAAKLMDISLHYNKPIGMGIMGPRINYEQAEERAEEYAKRAVKAAVEMLKIKNN